MFGRGGKQCQLFIEYQDCDNFCENEGQCKLDPSGLPVCKCKQGYGGDYCTVRDVSMYRRYKGAPSCQCRAKNQVSLDSLKGRWFLLAIKNNTYNPPDACVQLSVMDTTHDLKSVLWRNGSLAIRYLAKRNDTSSHHKVETITVDQTETILFTPSEGTRENTSRLFMVGTIPRLYAFPLTNVGTRDDHVVEFGVVYFSPSYLVLHSCISDKTHGHFDAVLILSKEKDDRQRLEAVLGEVYKELPYVTGNIVLTERNDDCKD